MSTEPKKHWLRWTQTSPTKHFPKPKYQFTKYLKFIGDSITTFPMEEADYIRFKDAAKFWAWHHDKRVRIHRQKLGNGLSQVVVTLMEHHRNGLPYFRKRS